MKRILLVSLVAAGALVASAASSDTPERVTTSVKAGHLVVTSAAVQSRPSQDDAQIQCQNHCRRWTAFLFASCAFVPLDQMSTCFDQANQAYAMCLADC